MNSFYSLLFKMLIGLTFCLQSIHAQNAGEVSLRFVSFPKSKEPVKVKLWLSEGKTIDIEAPSKWLSPTVRVAPLATWLVGEMVNGSDGKPMFKEYARATAPTSPEQILIMVRKGKDNANGFDLVALDARTDGFGAAKYLFMNATMVDIGGVVGGVTFAIKPKQHTIIQPKVSANEQTFHSALYYRKDEETKPFFSSEWRLEGSARTFIFTYHDPKTNHLRIHSIKDYIP